MQPLTGLTASRHTAASSDFGAMLTRTHSIMQSARNLTMPPPWSLYSWPAVFCQANPDSRLRLTHLGTRVTNPGSRHSPLCGQTMWGECTPEHEAGLAWDWVQICDGVVAMADPMCVVTNLRLVGEQGQVLTAREAALHLSRLVRQLPWQDEVLCALHVA